MSGQITIDRATLERLRVHAASASRLIGHLDGAIAAGPLGDHVDTIAHELGELLDNPHLIAASVPSARTTFALDVELDGVPELVAPDAPTASRTLIADDRMRHELAELPSAFTEDAATRPHVRQLRPAHGRQCQRTMRLWRPAHRRQRLGVAKVRTTSGTRQVETGWGRFTIAALLLALLGVISLLTLGACHRRGAAKASPGGACAHANGVAIVPSTAAPEHACASVIHFTSPMHLTSFT